MRSVLSFVVFLLAIASSAVYAWDNVVTGKVGRIEAHSPSSSSRNITVTIVGENSVCSLPTNNETAYIQKSTTPDTYQVMSSILLSAKVTNQDVTLYIMIGSEGCQVHRVDLL